jgi:TonB family protein
VNFVFTPAKVRLAMLAITILAHVLLLGVLVNFKFKPNAPVRQELDAEIFFVKSEPPRSAIDQKFERTDTPLQSAGVTDKVAASMAAPPAPTAEDWAFAAKYTNKNSKGYRHSWGQQVRSMMGTAIEGPDQGVVRFRIEIAPDGTLTKVETLWSTSVVAERLARKAMESMPPLPPTPTGKPLVFEKTIAFTPYAADGTPSYKDDCLPETPAFKNPFAWDGASTPTRKEQLPTPKLDAQAMEECLRQLPKDTLEAEMARDQRIMDQWGSSKSGSR